MNEAGGASHHWISRIVEAFLHGNLSVLLILISTIAGMVALTITPREEDPQIVVPIADVLISMPGASAAEVERQVSTRLEKLLYQIDGVEYVYSTSYPSKAIVTVRYFVGEDRERSWVKLHNKIQANIDQVPPGVTGWVIKPVEIDETPIVNLTLYSAAYGDYELRRMAGELEICLQGVKNAGRTFVVGGRSRQITLELSPPRMAAHGISLQDIRNAVQGANASLPAGSLSAGDKEMRLDAGRFLASAEEVGNLVVGARGMRPVYLRDVATITDGPAEPETYTRIAFGRRAYTPFDPSAGGSELPPGIQRSQDYPAVTVAVAKRKGTNAVLVAEEILKEARRFGPRSSAG